MKDIMPKFGKARLGILITIICSFILFTCDEDNPIYHDYGRRPTVITYDTLNAAPGWKICDSVDFEDSNVVMVNPRYRVHRFDGSISFGDGLQLDSVTGSWCWDTGPDQEYLGSFNLLISMFDSADLCDPYTPSETDTIYYANYKINVSGIGISIELIRDQLQGHYAEVSISLTSTLIPDTHGNGFLEAFEFIIAYDASVLTFIDGQAGALIDNDKFDYFVYSVGPFGNCGDDCPSGMLRFVSMRDLYPGDPNPYYLSGPGELAKIVYLVSNDYNHAGIFVPIQFYWFDCDDNIMIDGALEWEFLGLNVYDHYGAELFDPTETFGYSGPEDSCFDTVFTGRQSTSFERVPGINFRNGGIAIIPPIFTDDRGDINLNGVMNEIADAVVFANYFIYGPAAFTIDFERQKGASEVNGDGTPLTVADFVYLVRIIVGDALPNPQVDPDAWAKFAVHNNTVTVESNVELGAAFLVFCGTITPQLAPDAAHMDMIYNQAGDTTNVLVYSFEQGDAITTGDLIYYTGAGGLISVETAEYRGTMVNKIIVK